MIRQVRFHLHLPHHPKRICSDPWIWGCLWNLWTLWLGQAFWICKRTHHIILFKWVLFLQWIVERELWTLNQCCYLNNVVTYAASWHPKMIYNRIFLHYAISQLRPYHGNDIARSLEFHLSFWYQQTPRKTWQVISSWDFFPQSIWVENDHPDFGLNDKGRYQTEYYMDKYDVYPIEWL